MCVYIYIGLRGLHEKCRAKCSQGQPASKTQLIIKHLHHITKQINAGKSSLAAFPLSTTSCKDSWTDPKTMCMFTIHETIYYSTITLNIKI